MEHEEKDVGEVIDVFSKVKEEFKKIFVLEPYEDLLFKYDNPIPAMIIDVARE